MRSATPLWLEDRPTPPRRDPLPAEVEVAILGGGVAGCAVGYALGARGVAVALLEAGELASRASGRNDGQVLCGLGEHLNRLVGQHGHAGAMRILRFLGRNHTELRAVIDREHMACGYTHAGGLRLAASESEFAELSESASLLDAEGLRHRLVDASKLAKVLPVARGFFGALYVENEAVFDPAAFARGLAEAGRPRGLLVREHCPVLALSGDLGAFDVELARGERLRASCVVHATSALGTEFDRGGFLDRVVFAFRGQILATHELPDELARSIPPWAMSAHFCYEYFRRHARRLTLGGMRWSVRGEECGTTDDSEVDAEVGRALRSWLAEHLPDVAAAGVEREWTGIMCGTPDGLPLVGELPGRPGEFLSLGFNGYGMSFACLAGRILAELITEGRSSDPAAGLFDPRRFA